MTKKFTDEDLRAVSDFVTTQNMNNVFKANTLRIDIYSYIRMLDFNQLRNFMLECYDDVVFSINNQVDFEDLKNSLDILKACIEGVARFENAEEGYRDVLGDRELLEVEGVE